MSVPAVPSDMTDYMDGLDDFDSTDLVMPTLKVVSKDGVFQDGLSGQTFNELNVVLLGVVRQRTLWAPEVEEGQGPLCRSLDYKNGIPFIKEFPWSASGFNAADLPEGGTLPCDSCPLKDWGSHPKDDKPWCSEDHTYVVLQPVGSSGDLAPATLTFSRSGIKPSKAYLTSFARAKEPTFVAWTKIGLSLNKRGSVTYSVPTFARGEATDSANYPDWAQQFRSIREFLQTPRQPEKELEAAASSSPAPARSAVAASTPSDDDEIPF